LPDIISLKNLDPDLNCSSPLLTDLLRLWHDARGDRTMPARKDMDPLRLGPALLPHIMLIDVEHEPQPRFRWRLIGTHITTVLDRDMTGRYWDEIYQGKDLATLRLRADWVLQHRAPLRALGHATSHGQDFENLEALHLPLSDDDTTINMIFAASVYTLPSRAAITARDADKYEPLRP